MLVVQQARETEASKRYSRNSTIVAALIGESFAGRLVVCACFSAKQPARDQATYMVGGSVQFNR